MEEEKLETIMRDYSETPDDIHICHQLALKLLRVDKIPDSIAGNENTTLVSVLGDRLDKEPESPEIIQTLKNLIQPEVRVMKRAVVWETTPDTPVETDLSVVLPYLENFQQQGAMVVNMYQLIRHLVTSGSIMVELANGNDIVTYSDRLIIPGKFSEGVPKVCTIHGASLELDASRYVGTHHDWTIEPDRVRPCLITEKEVEKLLTGKIKDTEIGLYKVSDLEKIDKTKPFAILQDYFDFLHQGDLEDSDIRSLEQLKENLCYMATFGDKYLVERFIDWQISLHSSPNFGQLYEDGIGGLSTHQNHWSHIVPEDPDKIWGASMGYCAEDHCPRFISYHEQMPFAHFALVGPKKIWDEIELPTQTSLRKIEAPTLVSDYLLRIIGNNIKGTNRIHKLDQIQNIMDRT